MRANYTRGPNRFFLIHHVLARLRDRGWFSAHQIARATFFGVGRVHQQRLKRVREMLQLYVQAGILERNDQVAACPLYRHREVTLEEVDHALVEQFEEHAHQRRLTPSYKLGLQLLDQHLDQVVPKSTEPELFDKHGHLIDRKIMDHVDRMRLRPARPRVLVYLSTISDSTKPRVAVQG